MAWKSTWMAPPPEPKRQPKRSKALVHGLIAAGVVVIGAIVIFMTLSKTEPIEPKDEVVKAPKVAKGRQKVVPSAPKALVQPRSVEKVAAPPKKDVRLENGVEVVKSTVVTNKSGAVIEKLWMADGKTKSKIHPPKPIFENASDQLIAMAVSVKPGQAMPPLPDLSTVDQDFLKSMVNPVRIDDEDSEDVKDLKLKVMEARAYLAEEVKKGKTVREALQEYQAEMEKYADSHAMALTQIRELREKDGDQAAQEFRERVNEVFRARGIPELEAPANIGVTRRKAK